MAADLLGDTVFDTIPNRQDALILSLDLRVQGEIMGTYDQGVPGAFYLHFHTCLASNSFYGVLVGQDNTGRVEGIQGTLKNGDVLGFDSEVARHNGFADEDEPPWCEYTRIDNCREAVAPMTLLGSIRL